PISRTIRVLPPYMHAPRDRTMPSPDARPTASLGVVLPGDNGTIGALTPGPLTAQLSARLLRISFMEEGGPRHRYSCRCSEITRCQPRWHRGRLGNTPDGCGHGHGDAGSRSRAFLPHDRPRQS